MKSGQKGEFQYIKHEKKRRIIKAVLFFLVPIIIYVVGVIITKTNESLITVAAILLCLPACKVLVNTIMICLFHSMDTQLYDKIVKRQGSLTLIYELVLTNYEKNTFVDAIAICGNTVVGYSSDKKADITYAEEHTQKILHHNGYPVTVKFLKEESRFLERLESMNKNADSLRADISFTPDERYPDLSREELIKHTILAISL